MKNFKITKTTIIFLTLLTILAFTINSNASNDRRCKSVSEEQLEKLKKRFFLKKTMRTSKIWTLFMLQEM